jgi:hypothetical protein
MSHPKVLAILDRVEPLSAPADEPPFHEEDIRELASVPDAEKLLVAIARDHAATPQRRYAAAEALVEGRFANWRSSSANTRAVAEALAVAMRNDTTHNRWGLPGHFTGRLGDHLLSLPVGVVQALVPLLDEDAELHIEGSEAATLHSAARYRIADLAAYLLSRYRGLPWESHSDVARRDEAIAALRAKLQ